MHCDVDRADERRTGRWVLCTVTITTDCRNVRDTTRYTHATTSRERIILPCSRTCGANGTARVRSCDHLPNAGRVYIARGGSGEEAEEGRVRERATNVPLPVAAASRGRVRAAQARRTV